MAEALENKFCYSIANTMLLHATLLILNLYKKVTLAEVHGLPCDI